MEIAIEHSTVHTYDQPVRYGVQELRLTPLDTSGQRVIDWRIEMPGIDTAARWNDAYGNVVHLVNQSRERDELAIRVTGLVETSDANGILGPLPHSPTPRLFVRETALTRADRALVALASSLEGKHRDQIALYHALMDAIRERMEFDAGHTDVNTSAADALKAGHGVCQDFAHVFLAVCRKLDLPARYVTGYLAVREGDVGTEAQHAWVKPMSPASAGSASTPPTACVRTTIMCGSPAGWTPPTPRPSGASGAAPVPTACPSICRW